MARKKRKRLFIEPKNPPKTTLDQKYSSLRTRWISLLHMDHPVLETSVQTPLREETERQVKLDVDRCMASVSSQKEALVRVILYVFKRHPYLHYYQGFHDIASIVLMVMGEELARAAVEQLALFWLRDFMEKDLKGTLYQMECIMILLSQADPKLHSFLYGIPYFSSSFSLTWLLTWMSHDTRSMDVEVHLFDFYIEQGPKIALYFITALLMDYRHEMMALEPEYSQVYSFMTRLTVRNVDHVQQLVHRCLDLYHHHPLPDSLLGPYSCITRFHQDVQQQSGPLPKNNIKSILKQQDAWRSTLGDKLPCLSRIQTSRHRLIWSRKHYVWSSVVVLMLAYVLYKSRLSYSLSLWLPWFKYKI